MNYYWLKCVFNASELNLVSLSLSPVPPSKGSDVCGWGERVLLLPAGGPEVPRAAGAPGSLRPGGRAAEPGRRQAAEAGRVW